MLRKLQVRLFVADCKRRGRLRGDSRQRNFLRIGAAWIARLQAKRFELVGDVFDRKLLAFRTWGAPLEFIGRENLDVVEKIGCSDGIAGGFGGVERFGGERDRNRGKEKTES